MFAFSDDIPRAVSLEELEIPEAFYYLLQPASTTVIMVSVETDTTLLFKIVTFVCSLSCWKRFWKPQHIGNQFIHTLEINTSRICVAYCRLVNIVAAEFIYTAPYSL